MSQIAERLERLPFGKFHYRLLLMGGLGYMFEAVDAAIIASTSAMSRKARTLGRPRPGIGGATGFPARVFAPQGDLRSRHFDPLALTILEDELDGGKGRE